MLLERRKLRARNFCDVFGARPLIDVDECRSRTLASVLDLPSECTLMLIVVTTELSSQRRRREREMKRFTDAR